MCGSRGNWKFQSGAREVKGPGNSGGEGGGDVSEFTFPDGHV